MSSALLTATMQAAVLSALSNVLAQGLTAYRSNAHSPFDVIGLVHMVVLAILQTPPNFKWQMALEENFPSSGKKPVDAVAIKKKDDDAKVNEKEKGKETLSITNTVMKFTLDQTVGATLNTVFFIVIINLLRGAGWSTIFTSVQRVSYHHLAALYRLLISPFVGLLHDDACRLQVLAVRHAPESHRCPRRTAHAGGKFGRVGLGCLGQPHGSVSIHRGRGAT